MGQTLHSPRGWDGARKNYMGRGQRPHPLAVPDPIAIPTYI